MVSFKERDMAAFLEIISLAEEIRQNIERQERAIGISSALLGLGLGIFSYPFLSNIGASPIILVKDPILALCILAGLTVISFGLLGIAEFGKRKRRERVVFSRVVSIADELLVDFKEKMTTLEFVRASIRLSRLDN